MSHVSPEDTSSLSMMTEWLQRSAESARHLSLCFSLQEPQPSLPTEKQLLFSDSDSDVIFEFGLKLCVGLILFLCHYSRSPSFCAPETLY